MTTSYARGVREALPLEDYDRDFGFGYVQEHSKFRSFVLRGLLGKEIGVTCAFVNEETSVLDRVEDADSGGEGDEGLSRGIKMDVGRG
mmetsp:Transcript_33222/g.81559  ORF Transcript_33222/g.81559 Transcript_33222/m.81559 type:complete len:88 (+) Transcript_33222:63-326(+)